MIRKAVPTDIPVLLRMGKHFWAQTAYASIPYCPESITACYLQIMQNGLLLIGESGGRPAGMIGGVMSPMFANRSVLAVTELFWWVEPDARKSRIGLELLSGLERTAKELGASIVGMISLEAVEPEKINAIYKARGYIAAENTFMKFVGEKWPR